MLSFHTTYLVHVTSFQPYITKKYFEMNDPPVYLSRIAIGNGGLGSFETITELPVVSVLETYPQIIGYDTQVFEYFQEQYVEDAFRECLSAYFRPGVYSAGIISPCNTLNQSTFQL